MSIAVRDVTLEDGKGVVGWKEMSGWGRREKDEKEDGGERREGGSEKRDGRREEGGMSIDESGSS